MYRSESLYEWARNNIKDEDVYPIFVPSYNRPDAKILQHLLKEPELPIVLCIRREQLDMYRKWTDKCKILLLDNVHDISETRKAICEMAYPYYDNIFMFDDDICQIDFLSPSVTKNGKDAMRSSRVIKGVQPRWMDILKMWIAWLQFDPSGRIAISSPQYRPEGWNMKHANSELYPYNSGTCIQCIHLNLAKLHNAQITYKPHNQVGVEDYALQFDIMSSGLLACKMTDLEYDCPSICSAPGGNSNASNISIGKERYAYYVECSKKYYGDHPGVRYAQTIRTKLPSVKFNWKFWRSLI